MERLREVCGEIGWEDVRTYIQSGNVIFRGSGGRAKLAAALEKAIEEEFGFAVPVVVRKGSEWRRYAEGSPFPEAEQDRAKLLHLGLANKTSRSDAAQVLAPYCKAGEQIVVNGDALWIDYPVGIARTKLTPAVLDRAVGSPVTARNWKSVQAIAALVADVEAGGRAP